MRQREGGREREREGDRQREREGEMVNSNNRIELRRLLYIKASGKKERLWDC